LEEELGAESVLLTLFPVVSLVIVTVPLLVVVATMSTWMTSPALTEKPEKS
jgi:hypothetical protein